MTMLDDKCDVCNTNKPIGVASTAIPLSVAYCAECAKRHAQPLCVFLMWEEDIPPKDHACPDHMVTYENGKYITYRKWFNKRKQSNGSGATQQPDDNIRKPE